MGQKYEVIQFKIQATAKKWRRRPKVHWGDNQNRFNKVPKEFIQVPSQERRLIQLLQSRPCSIPAHHTWKKWAENSNAQSV
jgi:hypothetical protein